MRKLKKSFSMLFMALIVVLNFTTSISANEINPDNYVNENITLFEVPTSEIPTSDTLEIDTIQTIEIYGENTNPNSRIPAGIVTLSSIWTNQYTCYFTVTNIGVSTVSNMELDLICNTKYGNLYPGQMVLGSLGPGQSRTVTAFSNEPAVMYYATLTGYVSGATNPWFNIGGPTYCPF